MSQQLDQIEQGTDAWRQFRLQGIGASEIAAVLGVSEWLTPMQLFEIKTGRVTHEVDNWAIRKGNELEPKIRTAFNVITDIELKPALVVHPRFSYIRASLDGFNEKENRLYVEVKFQGKESHEKAGQGIIPDRYIPQTQWQGIAAQSTNGKFVSHNEDAGTFHIVDVIPNEAYQKDLMIAATQFWDLVLNDTPPPLTDRDFKNLRDKATVELFEEWKMAKTTSDSFAKKAEELRKLITAKLEHPRIKCGDVRVIKIDKKGSIDYKQLLKSKNIGDEECESFRKEGTTYFDFRIEKDKGA